MRIKSEGKEGKKFIDLNGLLDAALFRPIVYVKSARARVRMLYGWMDFSLCRVIFTMYREREREGWLRIVDYYEDEFLFRRLGLGENCAGMGSV